jgi:NSS family neurotransmitter:Na+ symporter
MGESFFDLFDNLTTKYTLPGGGLLVALLAGWVLLKEDREAGFRASGLPSVARFWFWTIRIVTPALVSLVILHGLGVIG